MSVLGELLELLHSGSSRWSTLEASGYEWTDPILHGEAFRRGFDVEFPPVGFGARSTPILTSSISGTVSLEEDGNHGKEEGEGTTENWQVWVQKPDRMRVEFGVFETVVAVFVGETWWSWLPGQGATTNAGDPHQKHGKGPSEPLVSPDLALFPLRSWVTKRYSDETLLEHARIGAQAGLQRLRQSISLTVMMRVMASASWVRRWATLRSVFRLI